MPHRAWPWLPGLSVWLATDEYQEVAPSTARRAEGVLGLKWWEGVATRLEPGVILAQPLCNQRLQIYEPEILVAGGLEITI